MSSNNNSNLSSAVNCHVRCTAARRTSVSHPPTTPSRRLDVQPMLVRRTLLTELAQRLARSPSHTCSQCVKSYNKPVPFSHRFHEGDHGAFHNSGSQQSLQSLFCIFHLFGQGDSVPPDGTQVILKVSKGEIAVYRVLCVFLSPFPRR